MRRPRGHSRSEASSPHRSTGGRTTGGRSVGRQQAERFCEGAAIRERVRSAQNTLVLLRERPFLRIHQGAQRIAEWARRRVTEDSAFWSVTEDFGALFRAWLLWDQQRDQPRDKAEFNRTLEKMAALKVSPDRLNCSTLVWQAYWQATKRHIDLSIPNRVTFGGLSGRMSTRFLNRLRPYLVLPDTFALTGKLYKVNGA